LPYNTRTLKKDNSEAIPVAQVYDSAIDDFVVLQGKNGSMNVTPTDDAGNKLFTPSHPGVMDYSDKMKEPFFSNTNMNKTFTETMRGFGLANDVDLDSLPPDPDVVFTIPEIDFTFTVKPGEIFDYRLNDFVTVEIISDVPFRAWGRG
jgi:hypothetical protein